MNNPKSRVERRSGAAAARAFTLVELLVVIGIIVLLVGILLPAVRKVRISGQKVSTQATLNRLSQACEAYFQDFGAYPGPFDEGEILSSGHLTNTAVYRDPVTPADPLYFVNADGTKSSFTRVPTSSENLFLGLCGGLSLSVTSPGNVVTFAYDPALARRALGPSWLNLNVAKKHQGYLEITDGDISNSDATKNPLTDPSSPPYAWWPGTGGPALTANFTGDSLIYEFMDRFGSPRPILYMRAHRGVTRVNPTVATDKTGFIYDPANDTNTAPDQYDPTQIQYSYGNFGTDAAGMSRLGKIWTADVNDYPDLPDPNNTSNIMAAKGNERYFVNEQLTTATGSTGYNRVPVQKDKFILISAGPDGIYGTADDIRN